MHSNILVVDRLSQDKLTNLTLLSRCVSILSLQLFEYIKDLNIVLNGQYLDALLTANDYTVLLEFNQGNTTQCEVTDVKVHELFCQPDKQAVLERIEQSDKVQLNATIKV